VRECPLICANDEYGIDWVLLERCLADPQTTLTLLCNPHNPVGKIWDKETLARIGELAYDNGVVAEPNAFAVQAAVAAFEHGGEWLDELREYLYENKRTVSEFLRAELPQIKLIPSQATYLL